MKILLEFEKDQFGKSAISLSKIDKNGTGSGTRLVTSGDFCGCGCAKTIKKFELDEFDLESMVNNSKSMLKSLKKFNKKNS